MDIEQLVKTLDALSGALADSAAKEVMVNDAVGHWLTQAQDKSLTPGVRETYLECAQTVTAIFNS